MGVRTTADDLLESAKEHLDEAFKCLMKAIDTDTWGSKDFSKDYLAVIEETILSISKAIGL